MPSIAIAPGVNANAAIAIELRAMADRLESRDNQVIALGAVIALQVGDVSLTPSRLASRFATSATAF